ncbi:MAG TPA: 30S ribosomal protein S5, partial [Marmoricola sp.]|nr:30S ribosomal protein S5 [Marmoricola sp.]
NIVHATVEALRSLENPETVAARRGLPVEEVAPAALLKAQADSDAQAPVAAAAGSEA